MTEHILVVDDDALLRRSLAYNLERAGYRSSTAVSGEDALRCARHDPPDLILLDIGLPGMDGLQVLKELQATVDVPVIFLTARRRELDEVLGLELGADDYVTKPFDLNVLLARIKVALRRIKHEPVSVQTHEERLEAGDLIIDRAAHTVTVAGELLELPPREFEVLRVLVEHADQVVSVDDLLASVWGAEYAGEPQVVYVHIRWLREKLEEDPNHPHRIITLRGVGYKLLSKEGHDAADPA
ncbi:MAG: response regulator transcription factor [Caldilineales bacterium]